LHYCFKSSEILYSCVQVKSQSETKNDPQWSYSELVAKLELSFAVKLNVGLLSVSEGK